MKISIKKQLQKANRVDHSEVAEKLKKRKIKNISVARRLNRSEATISMALKGNRPVTLLRIYNYYLNKSA